MGWWSGRQEAVLGHLSSVLSPTNLRSLIYFRTPIYQPESLYYPGYFFKHDRCFFAKYQRSEVRVLHLTIGRKLRAVIKQVGLFAAALDPAFAEIL